MPSKLPQGMFPPPLTFPRRRLEKASIGIILCRDANRIVVEYAMSRAMSPVMVAQYKRLLIPKEVLQRTFEEYLELPSSAEPVKGS